MFVTLFQFQWTILDFTQLFCCTTTRKDDTVCAISKEELKVFPQPIALGYSRGAIFSFSIRSNSVIFCDCNFTVFFLILRNVFKRNAMSESGKCRDQQGRPTYTCIMTDKHPNLKLAS